MRGKSRVRLMRRPLLHALSLALLAGAAAAGEPAGTVTVLEINGAIGPATSSYVVRGIASARERGSRLVVLEMDTPGGLDSAMRDIIRAILASPVPVATYVMPSGARAASAGTYILYASHIAAMAPATNLGAATPVSIGGESQPPPPAVPEPPGKSAPGKGSGGADGAAPENPPPGSAMEQKVIDLIARDLPDLLAQADGREVRVNERTVRLATRDLSEVRVKPDWRTGLLAVITNPTVAYGLMLIGIWGLLLEGYNPGAVLPGVVGSICLLIALFAFQILSVNYAGLALVVLGSAMIIAEFFFPAYGSLGAGGLIAFIVGSLILFDTDVPGMQVGRPLIAALAAVGGIVIAGIVYLATRAMRHPVTTGAPGMIGASTEVFEDFTGKGRVRYGGELWNARSDVAMRAGQMARIVRVEGLTLWVEPQ